jgi:hypothetical protein
LSIGELGFNPERLLPPATLTQLIKNKEAIDIEIKTKNEDKDTHEKHNNNRFIRFSYLKIQALTLLCQVY